MSGTSSHQPPQLVLGTRNRKKGRELRVFLASSATIVALAGIAAVGNFPDMVPARGSSAETSLTVSGSASSDTALGAMLIIVIIGFPLVLGYTYYVYKTFSGKIKAADAEY